MDPPRICLWYVILNIHSIYEIIDASYMLHTIYSGMEYIYIIYIYCKITIMRELFQSRFLFVGRVCQYRVYVLGYPHVVISPLQIKILLTILITQILAWMRVENSNIHNEYM